MFFIFSLIFKPIRRRDRGKYGCHVTQIKGDNKTLSYYVDVRVHQKYFNGVQNTSKSSLRILNQKKESIYKDNEKYNFEQDIYDHVTGIVGGDITLNCPTPSK